MVNLWLLGYSTTFFQTCHKPLPLVGLNIDKISPDCHGFVKHIEVREASYFKFLTS